VVNLRFAGTEEAAAPESALILGLIDRASLVRLVETLVLGLVAALALLLLARPAMNRLLAIQPAGGMLPGMTPAMAGAAGALVSPGPAQAALPAPGGHPALAAPRAGAGGAAHAGLLSAPEDESMIDVAQIEGAMRVSSIRKVADLVGKHPEEALVILRNWLVQEA